MKKKSKRRKRMSTLEEYSGVVVMGLVSPGSKSERMAAQLDIGKETLLLRRPGIRSYKDEMLEQLVGKHVTCHGVKRGNRLYLQNWELAESEKEPDEEQV